MILVVLVQGGNSGGVGAAFGGSGNSGGLLGATGATTLFGKLTYGAAAIFMVTSIWLSVLQGTGGSGHSKRLEEAAKSSSTTTSETQSAPADADESMNETAPAIENDSAPALDDAPVTEEDEPEAP